MWHNCKDITVTKKFTQYRIMTFFNTSKIKHSNTVERITLSVFIDLFNVICI